MELTEKKCVPCEGGLDPLAEAEEDKFLEIMTGWGLDRSGIHFIHKEFKFSDYLKTIEFVNLVAEAAEEEGHHPDLHVYWGQVKVDIHTHAIKGLHQNDFILAAKIDQVAKGM